MDWTIFWWFLAVLVVIAGLAGTIIPALPGVPLVFAGLFIIAWAGDFLAIGWPTVIILAVLTAIAWVVDLLAGALGARHLGASQRSFWGATIGAIAGLFFGLPGIILGPFIGAVLGELSSGRDVIHSSRVGVGTWLGMIVATALKLAIAFLMLGIVAFQLGFGSGTPV
ncbi:MAG TPA: DUF456 domain-containing protein [Xanthomonadales bacterium]|nr:DUF456 domain-containing protein [Xanthomonadales bacterium]